MRTGCTDFSHKSVVNELFNQSWTAGARLRALRLRTGMSMAEMAKALDLPAASSYQYWEADAKGRYFTADRVHKLAAVLVGRGEPPITKAEVLELGGLVPVESLGGRRRAVEPDQPPLAAPKGSLRILEYDVGAAGGHGAQPPDMEGDGTHTPVLAEWVMPEDLVAAHTTPGRQLALIRVEGDSMEPDYRPGERVLVDLSRKKPSPPGVFVIWDGMGLVLKRVELVPNSDAKRIRLSSINPGYQAYEIDLDEFTIVARVVGKWQWR